MYILCFHVTKGWETLFAVDLFSLPVLPSAPGFLSGLLVHRTIYHNNYADCNWITREGEVAARRMLTTGFNRVCVFVLCRVQIMSTCLSESTDSIMFHLKGRKMGKWRGSCSWAGTVDWGLWVNGSRIWRRSLNSWQMRVIWSQTSYGSLWITL